MKIYTRTGDDGTTSLFGGKRTRKDDPRVEAYGSIDELNSAVGFLISECKTDSVIRALTDVQQTLMSIAGFLAGSPLDTKFLDHKVTDMEHLIDEFSTGVPKITNFILPGGSPCGAWAHVARTVCRRAERTIVRTSKEKPVNLGFSQILTYINRLSDLLFVIARTENYARGINEQVWSGQKK